METSLNVKLMGAVAVVLAVIKFGLLPVIDWQNQLVDEIYQVERRNIKAQNLLSSQDQIFMKLATLDGGYKQKAKIYPVFIDQPSFRLETQKLYEMLLKQYNLHQTQFFWRDSEDKNAFGSLHKAKFNVNFNGTLKDFALLQSRLLAVNKQYKIANMSLNVRAQTAKSFGQVRAAITVEAFYWLGGVQ
ncbi:MAG: hypothetical protein MJK04_22035 [Psychrosphaera sp.]|nr:hypothetical protein [Psychrosphaera sp.]